ncbi:MAG: PadR family transcriptional regulator [Promethearchaeota archaeon]
MIKHVKNFNPKALINSEKYRQYVENLESEILRGISKLITLYAVKQKGEKGTYGYKLARDLKTQTNNALIIEEGTLYPILRKLKADGLLITKKKRI